MSYKSAAKPPAKLMWWEKTVEYAFVRACQRDWLAVPLDGDPERAGDALFGDGTVWLIVEFKKDREAIGAEAKKYKDFDNAARQLKERDAHHLIVYGVAASGPLEIRGTTYFSQKTVELDKIHLRGATFPEFKCYLDRLLALKKKATGSDSGSENFGSIVGVSKRDGRAVCLTLDEFNRGFRQEKLIEKSPAPPSFLR